MFQTSKRFFWMVSFFLILSCITLPAAQAETFEEHTRAGYEYLGKRDYRKAISEFGDAVHLNPKSSDAYYNLASAYEAAGELNKAIETYTKSAQTNPYNAAAYYNRAEVYRKKGRLDHTIEDWTKALELNPNYGAGYYQRGLAYKESFKFEESFIDFTKAKELGYGIDPALLEAARAAAENAKKKKT